MLQASAQTVDFKFRRHFGEGQDEHILAIIAPDKAIPLRVIEPFYYTLHFVDPPD